jgi:3-oxoacyl-[acyl-carrier protein] reductase
VNTTLPILIDTVWANLMARRPTLVRGNASEIMSLAGEVAQTKGVDSTDPVERALAIRADVRSTTEVQAMVRQASDWAGGPISALVNNAWLNDQFNGAVRGSLNTLQACRAGMQAADGGWGGEHRHQFVSKPGGALPRLHGGQGRAAGAHAHRGQRVGPQGIRVDMVSGGLLRITDASAATPPEVFDMIAAQTPLREVTTPENMADAVVMWLSPLARGITGQNLVVDGDLVMN